MNRNITYFTSAAAALVVFLAVHVIAQQPGRSLVPLTEDNLKNPSPNDWLMYNRTYDAQRFSPLQQINKSNVSQLKLAWSVPQAAGSALVGNAPAWLIEPLGENLTTALIAGDQVLGDIPVQLVPGCLQLASLSKLDVLLVHLASPGGNQVWKFNGADPWPLLTDSRAIEAIVQLLENRENRS